MQLEVETIPCLRGERASARWHFDLDFDEESGMAKATCEAFPEGIPEAILNGSTLHDYPVEGDNGLTYVEATKEQLMDMLGLTEEDLQE